MTLAIIYAVGIAHGLILAVIITQRQHCGGGYQPLPRSNIDIPMPMVNPPKPPRGGTGVAR